MQGSNSCLSIVKSLSICCKPKYVIASEKTLHVSGASEKTLHVSGQILAQLAIFQSLKFHNSGTVHCNITNVYSLLEWLWCRAVLKISHDESLHSFVFNYLANMLTYS